MLPPEKKRAAAQEAPAAASDQGIYDSTNSSAIALAPLSRNRWRARVQTPPLVAMYIMNSSFELCALECPDGLNRLRLRAIWDGPGHGKLYTLDTIRREDRYVGRQNMVDWWLGQPGRREAPEFTRSLAVWP